MKKKLEIYRTLILITLPIQFYVQYLFLTAAPLSVDIAE